MKNKNIPHKKKRLIKRAGEPNIVKESETSYTNKSITFFKSMEEESEFTSRQYASMTPEESLAAVTRMRLTAFPYLNTDLKPWRNTIIFD